MFNEEWKNEYRRELDKIQPSASSMEELERKLAQEKPAKRRGIVGRIAALAACAAIIIASVPLARLAERPSATPGTEASAGEVSSSADYAELYKKLAALKLNAYIYGPQSVFPEGAVFDGAVGGKDMPNAAPTAPSEDTSLDYSDTNLQVAGVQEADIVKTDGKYIYVLGGRTVYIVSAKDGRLEIVSKTALPEGDMAASGSEMYVSGGRLTVITNYRERRPDISGKYGEVYCCCWGYYASAAGAEIYDISDPAAPRLINSLRQDGGLLSSRMVGETLYLASVQYLYGGFDPEKPETFVPALCSGKNKTLVAASDVLVPTGKELSSASYLVLSGIDTVKAEFVSTKSVVGCGDTVYSTAESFYVAGYEWIYDEKAESGAERTRILRFTLENGRVEYIAEGTVPGNIVNQFAMDEYEGYFRIVTTRDGRMTTVTNSSGLIVSRTEIPRTNGIYILDKNLSLKGSLDGLAEDERVYSVRFDGNTAYFVTFRQTDPLFTVDTSDPSSPKLLGALKIPGFSEYMQPFGDGRLFGLGKDADENTGRAGCLKLAMFDVTDKTDVTIEATTLLKKVDSSEASWNHKAILADAKKNIVAFPAAGFDAAGNSTTQYLIFNYSAEEGFVLLTSVDTDSDSYDRNSVRGLFIGDCFYVAHNGGIVSYSMSGWSQLDSLKF